MVFKKLIPFILLGCLSSCIQDSESLDTPPEKLVNVLVDVHFIEGAMLSVRPADKDSMREVYYDQIFEIHDMNQEDFKRDMDILKSNPQIMEHIYDQVIEALAEMDNRSNSNEESPETKKQSPQK